LIDDTDASARISFASQTPTTLAESPRIPSFHNTYGLGVLRHRQDCGFESEEGFLQVGAARPRRNPWVPPSAGTLPPSADTGPGRRMPRGDACIWATGRRCFSSWSTTGGKPDHEARR